MGLWINIGILFCIIAASIIGVYIAVIRYGQKDEYLDNTIGINFMAHHCDGRFMGVEKGVELGRGGRKIITLSPRDVNPKLVDKISDVKVIVDKDKCISLPKGFPSRDRNINIYLPPSIQDFPPKLRETLFGKALMYLTVLTDTSNAEIDALQEGMKRANQHLKSLAGGEISQERMTQLEEIYTDLLEYARDSKRDRFPSAGTIQPPPLR